MEDSAPDSVGELTNLTALPHTPYLVDVGSLLLPIARDLLHSSGF